MKKAKKKRQKGFMERIKFKGDATIFLIIGVAVIAGIMLAGGIFPNVSNDTLNKSAGAGQIDNSTLPGADGKKSLQLNTFKFKKCAEIMAVEFLIDSSGSMAFGTKLSNLQTALTSFASKMTDSSVVAMRTFSETTRLVVPFGFYKDNNSQLRSAINSLNPDGGTYTKNAFSQAQNDVTAAIGNPNFTKYDFNVIFFSDGIPETLGGNQACQGLCTSDPQAICRCFDENQNPTDIATAIKALKNNSGKNVRIFSVLLYDPIRDGFAESRFKKMMKDIASENSYFETTRPEDLESIFSQISGNVCQ